MLRNLGRKWRATHRPSGEEVQPVTLSVQPTFGSISFASETIRNGSEQLQYVHSIPKYVATCNIFVALVPKATHSDTGEACSFHSWLQRGWCRTEIWCHFVSGSKPFIVVVKHENVAQFAAPLWHRYPVHSGDFSVETDRALCTSIVQEALTKHLWKLQSKNLTAFRLHLSLFEEMTGLPGKRRGLNDFCADFSFSQPLGKHRGLGPIACAALSGDHELLRQLAVAKASINTHAPGMPETMRLPDFTPLHLAAWFRSDNLQVLQTLLELQADPNRSTMNMSPPLGFCRSVAAVELLVQHNAEVSCQGKALWQYFPLHLVALFGAPSEVVVKLLELRADVGGGRGGMASESPLHCVAFSGDSNNDLRSAQLLVDHKANVNQVVRAEGTAKVMEWLCRAYSQIPSAVPGATVKLFRDLSATPLGHCAICNNEGLLTFLLRARADPEIRNHRGKRPMEIATAQRIQQILTDPQIFIYLLESDSELLSETM